MQVNKGRMTVGCAIFPARSHAGLIALVASESGGIFTFRPTSRTCGRDNLVAQQQDYGTVGIHEGEGVLVTRMLA